MLGQLFKEGSHNPVCTKTVVCIIGPLVPQLQYLGLQVVLLAVTIVTAGCHFSGKFTWRPRGYHMCTNTSFLLIPAGAVLECMSGSDWWKYILKYIVSEHDRVGKSSQWIKNRWVRVLVSCHLQTIKCLPKWNSSCPKCKNSRRGSRSGLL